MLEQHLLNVKTTLSETSSPKPQLHTKENGWDSNYTSYSEISKSLNCIQNFDLKFHIKIDLREIAKNDH